MKGLYLYLSLYLAIFLIAEHRCSSVDKIYLTKDHVILNNDVSSNKLHFGIVHPDHQAEFSLSGQYHPTLFKDFSDGSSNSFQKPRSFIGPNITIVLIDEYEIILRGYYRANGLLYFIQPISKDSIERSDQSDRVLLVVDKLDTQANVDNELVLGDPQNVFESSIDIKRSVEYSLQTSCTPSCINRTCGSNGCGGVCGSCSGFDACNEQGWCVNICESNCSANQCTLDRCGNTCSKCSASKFCNLSTSMCEVSSTPDISTVLNFHNHHRERHDLAPLSWSTILADSAMNWAQSCTYGHSSTFYGENIATAPSSSYSYQDALMAWLLEERQYDCINDKCIDDFTCLNFRQMIWNETNEVGCARAVCTKNSPFANGGYWTNIVCHYAPIGNILGKRPFPDSSCEDRGCEKVINCTAQSRECGYIYDGCLTRSCGSCNPDPTLCHQESGLCGCTPTTTCENKGQTCGTLFDGCATISCGPACAAGTPDCKPMISADKLPSVCLSQEKQCGEVTNGCTVYSCGSCQAGSTCQLGQCVPCAACPRYSNCEERRCVCLAGFVRQGSLCEIVTDNPQWSFFSLLGNDNWTILPVLQVDAEPLGELHQLTASTDTQILAWLNTHPMTTVADVALSARILPLKNAVEWGLVWRSFSRSDKNGLQFMAFTFELTDQDRGEFKYSIRVNETFKRSFSSNFSAFLRGMKWNTNVGHRMQVIVQGKTYEFYLDGVLISEPVTMDHLPLGGYFGLYSRGPAIFRNMRLNTFTDLEIKLANCMNVTQFIIRLAQVLNIRPNTILMDRSLSDGCAGSDTVNVFDFKLLGSDHGTSAALVSSLRTMISENNPILSINQLIILDLLVINRNTAPNTFDLFGQIQTPQINPEPSDTSSLSDGELAAIIIGASLAGISCIVFIIVYIRVKRGQIVPFFKAGSNVELTTYQKFSDLD